MDNFWKLDPAGVEILATVDTIATQTVRQSARRLDEEVAFPREALDDLRSAGLLGLVSRESVGGRGQGLRTAVALIERFARECPATAMVTKMHLCGAAVIDKHGTDELGREIAQKGKIATLAFSEFGSRSHFWVPVSTAEGKGETVVLNATKQLITSAGHCDIYVWSSKPANNDGLSSIWYVPSDTTGLDTPVSWDGLGLRGNCSAPIHARGVEIPASYLLGTDGGGFDVMMGTVMPYFSMLNCAVSVGLCEGAFALTVDHVTASKYSYNGQSIAQLPQVRGHLARMRVKIDMLSGLLLDSIDALEGERPDAQLRVLEAKAAGAETALEVLDLAMRVSGGAAYRRDNPLERFFRDSRAAVVMAPVTDALYEFIGKAVCGMPVFE